MHVRSCAMCSCYAVRSTLRGSSWCETRPNGQVRGCRAHTAWPHINGLVTRCDSPAAASPTAHQSYINASHSHFVAASALSSLLRPLARIPKRDETSTSTVSKKCSTNSPLAPLAWLRLDLPRTFAFASVRTVAVFEWWSTSSGKGRLYMLSNGTGIGFRGRWLVVVSEN
jgi:hypothetical protein